MEGLDRHELNAWGRNVLIAMGELKVGLVQRRQRDGDVRPQHRTRERLVGTGTETALLNFTLASLQRTPVERLAASQEFEARSDIVDVLGQVLRDVVLVASDVCLAGLGVFVVVVLGLEQTLSFVDFGVELEPLFVGGVGDAGCVDAGVGDPVVNGVDSLLGWGEDLVDLFWGVPLSIAGRERVGARAWSV